MRFPLSSTLCALIDFQRSRRAQPKRPTKLPRTHRKNGRAGFSLVEIILALGIIAFAFVALFGLIPVGLRTFEGALDTTVQTQILQFISARARQTKFSELHKLDLSMDSSLEKAEPDYFFDDQGRELAGTKETNARDYIYAAAVSLRDAETIATEFPAGATPYVNGQVATLRIVVTKRSAPKEKRVFPIYIANNGL